MIYDISPPLDERSAVWPGDTSLRRHWHSRLLEGGNYDLSTITSTVHIGAHADAPSHYNVAGKSIDQVALEAYWGPCLVISISTRPLILADDLAAAIASGARRILVRTGSQRDRRVFNEDFVAFSPEAIRAMGSAGVLLVGIDTASVDCFDSKDLQAHQELFNFGMANLEGLDLSSVPDGHFELSAIPLRLVGFDASPVRAVLKTLELSSAIRS